jgi:hypothetical protein
LSFIATSSTLSSFDINEKGVKKFFSPASLGIMVAPPVNMLIFYEFVLLNILSPFLFNGKGQFKRFSLSLYSP